jgi:hypothetical protein
MNDVNPQPPVARTVQRKPRPPRARPYLRLLWLIPGLTLLGAGLYAYHDVEDDGRVTMIQLTTKPGLVGQTSEALRLVQPGNPDLYLKIKFPPGQEQTRTFKDTPIGNGLIFPLNNAVRMREIREIEVWDENAFRDDFKDRMPIASWNAEGQTFRVDLLGEKFRPPGWALPVAAAGGVIALIALLRFVWDQVI